MPLEKWVLHAHMARCANERHCYWRCIAIAHATFVRLPTLLEPLGSAGMSAYKPLLRSTSPACVLTVLTTLRSANVRRATNSAFLRKTASSSSQSPRRLLQAREASASFLYHFGRRLSQALTWSASIEHGCLPAHWPRTDVPIPMCDSEASACYSTQERLFIDEPGGLSTIVKCSCTQSASAYSVIKTFTRSWGIAL